MTPKRVQFFDGQVVKHISCGPEHCAAVTGEFCFLILSNSQQRNTNTVNILSHQMCIQFSQENGMCYTWGCGKDGQLGLGDIENHYEPAPVTVLSNQFISITGCGGSHTIMITGTHHISIVCSFIR